MPNESLENSPRAAAWLKQFSEVDREVARQLLRQLRLVSESEFEREVQRLLRDVLESAPKENFALMSITEPPNEFVKHGGRRIAGSSADRVRHLIENTARVYGARVSANPTVQSMRAQRIRNVVLVEDFVGSGTRLKSFWREEAPKSVKSWISYGWTKVWLVTYAALEEGIRAVSTAIKGLDESRIRMALDPRSSRLGLTEPMKEVASRYGAATQSEGGELGYGRGGATIVFQHGCPNNAPLILWEDGKKFRALFPNRGIPADLQQFFGQPPLLERTELLWQWQQYRLALSLLESMEKGRAGLVRWELTVALAMSARHQAWDDQWLASKMRLSIDEIARLRSAAYSLHLIDPNSHALTAFGREMLHRLRATSHSERSSAPARKQAPQLTDLYYPDTCGGKLKHQPSEAS